MNRFALWRYSPIAFVTDVGVAVWYAVLFIAYSDHSPLYLGLILWVLIVAFLEARLQKVIEERDAAFNALRELARSVA